MSRAFRFLVLILGGILSVVLAACAGSTPQLIASYPSQPQSGARAPLPQTRWQWVYDAWLELACANPDRAARQAESLAYDYGGYLESAQSWSQSGDTVYSLVLAVPAANFDGFQRALQRLGEVRGETVSGGWSSGYPDAGGMQAYSRVTVRIIPRESLLPDWRLPDWRPLHTFGRALDVFLAIFGFLIDGLIWLVVVAGPFVLAIWLGRALHRRLRR